MILALVLIATMVAISLGLQIGAMIWPPGGSRREMSAQQREALQYVHKLLGNYRAAHASSALTEAEIEEVLRLCEEKVEEVLSC